MFDISTRVVSEQDEISGLETLGWENHSWKYLSLIVDERVINLQRTKVYVFSDSVLCLGKILETERCMGRQIGMVQIISWIQKHWQNRRWANGIREEYFARIQCVAAQWRSQTFTVEIRWDTREFHRKNSIYVNVQRHFLWNKRQWNRMSGTRSSRIFCMQGGLVQDNGHLLVLVLKKKWYSISEDSPQGVWDNIAERMLVEFAESGCPIDRATSPLSRGQLKSKGHGKLSIHYAADLETVETIFRKIVSANQLSLYGAVAEICEEYESLHERTERPVMMGQSSSSLALSVIKTEVPLDSDDPANQDLLLQQMWRTNWKAVTTRQIEQILNGRRISECCWLWTVLQDKRHCRSLTISCSGLSWIHSSKRRRSIKTKRMDPREHKDWAPIRSCNQLLAW